LNENNNDALLKSLDIAEKSISSVTKTNNRLIIALITISVILIARSYGGGSQWDLLAKN
jgi:hypothetical protein